VSGGHQKYFGEMHQSKLVKTRRDSAKVHAECKVCLSLVARLECVTRQNCSAG
jgi:hypothetical protein